MVDELVPGLRGWIVRKTRHDRRRWREAEHVDPEPADERSRVSLWRWRQAVTLQLREHEAVDFIDTPRLVGERGRSRLGERLQRPPVVASAVSGGKSKGIERVHGPGGTAGDPVAEFGLIRTVERLVGGHLARRHTLPEVAPGEVSGHNRWSTFTTGERGLPVGEIKSAAGVVCVVARQATSSQQRRDLLLKRIAPESQMSTAGVQGPTHGNRQGSQTVK